MTPLSVGEFYNAPVRKIVLLLSSILISLLLAEVLLRLVHAAPEVQMIQKGRFRLSKNPKIGFEPVPGLDYHGAERSFFDYEGASNSQGFRDTEHAETKPAGVFRVVVIGDSVGAGLKVERYEDTFPPILQKMLIDRGLKAEVINLSVSGYNTQQEVELFREHGLAYHPDLVIVAYTLGDRERLEFMPGQAAPQRHPGLRPVVVRLAVEPGRWRACVLR